MERELFPNPVVRDLTTVPFFFVVVFVRKTKMICFSCYFLINPDLICLFTFSSLEASHVTQKGDMPLVKWPSTPLSTHWHPQNFLWSVDRFWIKVLEKDLELCYQESVWGLYISLGCLSSMRRTPELDSCELKFQLHCMIMGQSPGAAFHAH